MNDDLDINAIAGAKAKGARPYFFEDPAVERVFSITLAVATELGVMRERVDTIERLLEAGQPVSKASIDAFRPDSEAARERQLWHAEYIARIFRIVQQELEALKNPELNKSATNIADDLAGR